MQACCRRCWTAGACPADLLTILFGVGVLQVLLTAPAGLAAQVPADLRRLGRAIAGLLGRRVATGGGAR